MAQPQDKITRTQVTARIGDLRISPRKVRLVTDMIKHKPVTAALQALNVINKKSAKPIIKLINSALANARNNFQMETEGMFVKSITVNTGRVLKRFMPRAQGRAFPILRRTSIVDVVLEIKPQNKHPEKLVKTGKVASKEKVKSKS